MTKTTKKEIVPKTKWFPIAILCLTIMFFALAHSADSLVHRGYAKMCNDISEDCYFKELRIFRNGTTLNRCICLINNNNYEIKEIKPTKGVLSLVTDVRFSSYD